MLRCFLLVSFSVGALACGAPIANGSNDSTAPQAVSDDGAGCHKERRVGSNIEREVCRTPEEVRREREDARNLMTPGKVAPKPTGSAP